MLRHVPPHGSVGFMYPSPPKSWSAFAVVVFIMVVESIVIVRIVNIRISVLFFSAFIFGITSFFRLLACSRFFLFKYFLNMGFFCGSGFVYNAPFYISDFFHKIQEYIFK